MIVLIRSSFEKDSRKLNSDIKKELYTVIQRLQSIKNLSEFTNCKKLSGHKNAYRIRLGNYRIGLFYSNNSIDLVRILHRKDVYRYLKPQLPKLISFNDNAAFQFCSLIFLFKIKHAI
jgi:mRNA interferase RelE/StbE